jgi:hypothetical protein
MGGTISAGEEYLRTNIVPVRIPAGIIGICQTASPFAAVVLIRTARVGFARVDILLK